MNPIVFASIVISSFSLILSIFALRFINKARRLTKEYQIKLAMKECFIDCTAAPFIPEGWTVEKHKLGKKQYKFDPDKIILYQSKKQIEGGYSTGDELCKELEDRMVLNANVLDYLLAHQELIPESWKESYICFVGTIYRGLLSNLYVRYLRWDGSRWFWVYGRLDSDFHSNCFSAVAS